MALCTNHYNQSGFQSHLLVREFKELWLWCWCDSENEVRVGGGGRGGADLSTARP